MEKWENPAIINENQLPGHADFPDEAFSLNGQWRFYCRRGDEELPLNFFQTGFDDSNWEMIDVPCCWETRGYGSPCYYSSGLPSALVSNTTRIPLIDQKKNYIGYYRRSFTLPEDFSGKQVILRFGSARSALLVWVNGRYAGMSKGSMLPSEFDISKLLKPGENLLAARVYQYSDASYLEDQDMWFLSGLYRDVDIYALPHQRITDLYAKADFSDDFKSCELSVEIQAENAEGLTVRIAVLDGNNVAYYGEGIISRGKVCSRIHCPNVKLWSAETPSLYRIAVILWDGSGICHTRQIEYGFRKISVEDGQLTINGMPLKFRGVNYHAFTPDNGYYVPENVLRKDLQTMKRFNINAVRTSHYPQSELFYRLCDTYGIYVMDECNMDSHGIREKNIPGDNPTWTAHVTDRISRMVLRDRNHPCVVAWSLGNDSGMGSNLTQMRETALALDNTRPVHYGADEQLQLSDFCCDSYPSLRRVQQFAEGQDLTEKPGLLQKMLPSTPSQKSICYECYQGHPIVASQFYCCMGNSGADLRQFMELLESSRQWCGGFIWDYKDKALLDPKDSSRFLRSGSDFGLKIQPVSAGCSGLTNPHGEPHQGFYEIQKAFQSIVCSRLDNGKIQIFNRNSFLSTSHFHCGYELTRDGNPVESGTLIQNVPPRSTGEFSISLTDPMIKPGRYHLTLRFSLKEDAPYAPAGAVMAYEQWEICCVKHIIDENPGGSIRDDGERIYLKVNQTIYTISRSSGNLEQIHHDGKNLLTAPLMPSFYRPMTDTDVGFAGLTLGALKRKDEWEKLTLKRVLPKPSIFQIDHMTRSITVAQSVGAGLMRTYRLLSDGSLTVEMRLRTGKRPPCRIGMYCQLPRELEQFSWFGKGPHDTYRGRDYSGILGNHKCLASDQDEHVRPQEHGNKSQVYSLHLTASDGHGLQIRAQDPISASVWPYTLAELDNAESISDLRNHTCTTLNVDCVQNGLGDCFVPCPDEYKIQPNTTYAYSFTITPI